MRISKLQSTTIFIAAYYAKGVFSSFDQMEKIFQKLQNDTLRVQGGDPSVRGLVSMMGPTLHTIDGYGCWCYFGAEHGHGRGHPVNEVDSLCQWLHHGYECTMVDHFEENGEGECIPWEVDYTTGAKGDVDGIVADCAARNMGNNCATRSCIVEGMFVTNVFQKFFGGLTLDHTKNHDHPDFDPKANCPTNKGKPSPKSCCGLYPFRHPYKTYDGERACCGVKTYDVNILTCCDDGHPRLSCMI